MPRVSSSVPASAAAQAWRDTDFAARIIEWQRTAGRHHLPWQGTRDPYRIWISEIMLQQTQVATVIPYYQRFMERFPSVLDLADADEADVLALWSGLGYYARGRNLHRAARLVRDQHDGVFPRGLDAVMALPGVGRSTAGAICAFAYGEREPILDGNVKRVLTRAFGIQGSPTQRAVQDELWALSRRLLPEGDIEAYTQGLMDLGAGLCMRARPACDQCPLRPECVAWREDLTAVLPTPPARKLLPHRRTIMLIVREDAAVLMEQRPAPGIWGGLWCFPQADDESGQQRLLDAHGLRLRRATALAEVRHAFTHYRLTIEPRLLDVERCGLAAGDGVQAARWMSVQEARASALPAPVRALLDAMAPVTATRGAAAGA